MEELNNQEVFSTEQKLQYENNQLKTMLNNAQSQLQQINLFNVFKKFDYMFKVLEHKDSFDNSFITTCKEAIEEDFNSVFFPSREATGTKDEE